MPNPALNDDVFQRETRASQGSGSFTPGWGSPASELPPDVFDTKRTGQAGPVGGDPRTTSGPIQTGGGDTMTTGGSMSATAILLALVVVAGWFGWQQVTVTTLGVRADGSEITSVDTPGWLFIAAIVGFGIAVLTVFKPKLARITGPLYALSQGLFVGAISHVFEASYRGVVLQAVLLTIAVFTIMLVLFATGAIKVTDRLRTGIMVATGAIFVVYLFTFILGIFGADIPMIHEGGLVGIGFSLLVVGVAAFNLLLDFDFIQRGVEMQAPKYMEWYAAFGLMVTLVWLYLEILRLLAKLRER
jgi:uncharacterized YccA/Bax inhibitor family protein